MAQALFDLEATNNELKADLRDLYINSAKEVDIASGRKAIVIQVPFRLLKAFHKVQQRLVRELEKKFSGKDVVIVANRRIMPKPTTGAALARPRSRTLTAGTSPWLDLQPPRAAAGLPFRAQLLCSGLGFCTPCMMPCTSLPRPAQSSGTARAHVPLLTRLPSVARSARRSAGRSGVPDTDRGTPHALPHRRVQAAQGVP